MQTLRQYFLPNSNFGASFFPNTKVKLSIIPNLSFLGNLFPLPRDQASSEEVGSLAYRNLE
jgi:hypothetical protein